MQIVVLFYTYYLSIQNNSFQNRLQFRCIFSKLSLLNFEENFLLISIHMHARENVKQILVIIILIWHTHFFTTWTYGAISLQRKRNAIVQKLAHFTLSLSPIPLQTNPDQLHSDPQHRSTKIPHPPLGSPQASIAAAAP